MGELLDYYVIESVVEYVDDPLKIGRIRASIPGVIHHTTTTQVPALPWVRPFKMYGYQTFTKPLKGQKVWILVNKSNYNEFWWFPFYETIDIVQGYLNEYYEDTPDVFHAREEMETPIMSTWDNKQGYKQVIGEDYIDFFPTRQYKLNVHDCNINVTSGGIIEVGGDNSDAGQYEPAIMGRKCEALRGKCQKACRALAQACMNPNGYTIHLKPAVDALADAFTCIDLKCKKCHVN